MAKENIKLLQEKLMQDENLQSELKKRVASQENKEKNAIIETVLIPFAQELDLPFSLEEYEIAKEELSVPTALSEEELEVISGGAAPSQQMVGTTWGVCLFVGVGWDDDQGGKDCTLEGLGFCFGIGTDGIPW